MKKIFLILAVAIIVACESKYNEEFTYKLKSPAFSEVFHNGEMINIKVEVSHYVENAEFYFDNERIGTSNGGLVELTWTPVDRSGGNHNISIKLFPLDFEPVIINMPLLFEYTTGEQIQGGIIFYLDETGIHGMAVASGDVTYKNKNEFIWGPETFIGAIDSVDGSSNTVVLSHSEILASYVWPAFKLGYIYAGYDDWYVASKKEMLKLLDFISTTENELSMNKSYWTSTECCRALACAVDFNSRKAITCLKADSMFRIRPVRKF